MGYNGSNRRGYDIRYKGLKKSSMRVGNRLFDSVAKLGLLAGSKLLSNTPSVNETMMGLADADFYREGQQGKYRLSEKGLTIIVSFLVLLVPLFQWLCYYMYTIGWWPFFAFLIFGFLAVGCLGLSEMLLDTNENITPRCYIAIFWCILVMTLANILFGLWPFWLVPYELFTLVHSLVVLQDIISVIILVYLFASYKRIVK